IAWGGVNTPWILQIVFAFKLKHNIKFISLKHQKLIQRYFVPLVFLLKIMRFIISNIKKGKVKLLSLSLPNGDYSALYDGWGGDLEKTFSLEKTINELDTNKYNCLHIFYKWQNKNYKFMERFSSVYQFISGSQNLIKIESSFNPKCLKYVYITFKQLKLLTKKTKLDSNYLIKFLLFPFTYISLIEADRYKIIAKNYFSNTKLNTYVSCDGSSRLYRAKMNYAKSKGIKTISVPHGYDLFTEPIGYYLGDKIYTGYGKRKDLVGISGYEFDRIKIKVNRGPKILNKKKMGKILFLFSDTHIRHFDYHPKEFMFFVDLIEYVSISIKRSIELKFHPNLVNDSSYKTINTYLNKKFKGQTNISINYELKAESEYKDSAIMFSTNVVSSAMVFATFHGVPVYYLKTKWSSVNNYFSLVNSLDNRNSILIDSIPNGARIILSLINSEKEFQGKSLNSFINYQFSNSSIN
ncbi:hypothetical protein OAR31_02875, partial [Candidatus Marinimicrobia bacterium]|nr:hypothetical protein [Candidatus Neomarinimicrobiota bacterium]